MSGKTTILLVLGMIAAIVLGGLLGHYAPGLMLAISFVGKLYINILTALVILLILSGVILGISNLGNIGKLTRSGGKAILYYAVTGIIAVLIGLIAIVIFSPGSGYHMPGATETAGQPAHTIYSLYSVLLQDNSLSGMSPGSYFGFVLLVILFGAGLTVAGTGARTVVTFFKGTADVIGRLARLMLIVSPIGLLSLVGASVAMASPDYGDIFSAAGGYTLTVVVALVFYAVVLMPIILRVMGGKSIAGYYGNLSGALTAAFGTASSVSALPFTYEAVIDRNKVDQRAGSLVLPLGTVFNFGPTALVVTIGALFIAQAMGVYLGFWKVLLIALTAMVTSIGLAGMPGVIGPLMVLVLGIVAADKGLATGISIVVAADWLVDRLRSTANLCGDAVGAAVVGETFEFKTSSRTTAKPGPARRQPRTTRKTRQRNEPTSGTTGSDRKWERGEQRGKDRRDRQPRQSSRSTRDSRDRDRRSTQREQTTHRRNAPPSPFQVTDATPPALDVRASQESTPPRVEKPPRETTPHRLPQPPREQHRPPRPPRPERHQEREQQKPQEKQEKQAERQQESRGEDRSSRLTRDKIERELARVTAQLRPTDAPRVEEEKPEPVVPPAIEEEPERKPAEPEVTPHEPTHPVEREQEENMPSALADATGFADTEPVEEKETPKTTVEPEKPEFAHDVDEIEDEEAPAPMVEEEPEPDAEPEPEPKPEPEPEPESEPEPEPEPESESKEEEPEEVTYGRTKSRHRLDRATAETGTGSTNEPNEEPEVEDSFSNEGISFGRSKRKKTR